MAIRTIYGNIQGPALAGHSLGGDWALEVASPRDLGMGALPTRTRVEWHSDKAHIDA